MKAGVFPLNSQAIDRSRVLKSSESTATSLSTLSTTSTVNSRNNMSTIIDPKDSNAGSSMNASTQVGTSSTSTTKRVVPSFTSSRQAVSYLDQVIEELMSSDDGGDGSDASEGIDEASSDEGDFPYQYIPSQSPVPKRKQAPSKEASTRKKQRPNQPSKRLSSKQQARKIIGFDTSDEEEDHSIQQSLDRSQKSLQAINKTLHSMFGSSSTDSPQTNTKRTLLKKANGQVMTEQTVIRQLEEQRNRINAKKSRPYTSRSSAASRRTKTQ